MSTPFDGKWNVSIATPIGTQEVLFDISSDDGELRGSAHRGDEVSEFIDPKIEGDRMTWKQKVRHPLRLNLRFDVTVDGDIMAGVSRAGKLPSSDVRGHRAA
jgi:hypothetical protein